MKIGIAYSLAPAKGDVVDGPDDRYEEFDRPETVDAIASVIRDDGHDVTLLGDGREFLSKMLADPPDFVFNIAEGSGVSRNREARVPAVCEMLGVPYSGSDPLTLAATLDKDIAKRLLAGDGVNYAEPFDFRIPAGSSWPADSSLQNVIIETSCNTSGLRDHTFPVILKPALEGSSKGIRGRCIAETPEEVGEIFSRLAAQYQQPILIEDFIEGDEVTVGIVNGWHRGYEHFSFFGVMQIVPTEPVEQFVYSLEVKRDWKNRVRYETPAERDNPLRRKLFGPAYQIWHMLGLRDLARIDFRIAKDGMPYFIEVNPLPGLSPITSDLVIMARGYGVSYEDLIRRILHGALQRVGLMERPK